jgi:hypothetical protein
MAGNLPYQQMINFVRQHTKPTDSFILLNMGNFRSTSEYMRFTRVAERENFVVFKFVPAGTQKLYEWFVRNQLLGKLEKAPTDIPKIAHTYGIDYIVTQSNLHQAVGRKIYENEVYQIYKINDQ